MARKAKNTAMDEATTNESVVADVQEAEVDTENKTVTRKRTPRKNVKIDDGEEIEVISLIPNVSYYDKKTGDEYEWEKNGHIEYMTFETLKDMWRNNKGYFRNMWLKPLDERVVAKFGLTKVIDEYDFIMNTKNYNRKNIDKLLDAITNSRKEMRFTICNKIKSMVVDGDLQDIAVIRALENKLDADFVSLI